MNLFKKAKEILKPKEHKMAHIIDPFEVDNDFPEELSEEKEA